MTDSERDHFESGIAVLADTSEDIPLQEPYTVSGVALPVNTVVEGGQNTRHYYPEEVLREAADMLEGVDIVKNFHDLEGQAPADDVIGRVTDVAYREGWGLVYEGEITDREIKEKIGHGYLEVSPSLGRALGDHNESLDAREVKEIAGFRDLAVVANGQPGADIELGGNAAVTALGMDALSAGVMGGDEPAESGRDTNDGDSMPSNDDPSGASSSGSDTTNEDSETMSEDNNLTADEEALLNAVSDPEQARDVLSEYNSTEDAKIVAQTELETLQEDSEKVREILAEELEHRGSPFGVDTLCEKFTASEMEGRLENDEGEVEFESLSQSPETGEPDTPDESETDTLSDEDEARIAEIDQKLEVLGKSLPQERVDALKEEAADLAGEDSYDAAMEVL